MGHPTGRHSIRLYRIVFAVFVGVLFLAPAGASAEFFASLYAGGSISQSGNLKQTSGGVDEVFENLDIDDSVVLGAKAGYWFLRFFGLELDLYTYTADIPAQTVTAENQTTSVRIQKAFAASDIRLVNVGLNGLFRFPWDDFEPYVGSGDSGGTDDGNFAVGAQALAGLKYFFFRSFALFAEYKFSRVEHAFRVNSGALTNVTNENDSNTHHIYGGVSFHLRLPLP